MKPFWNLQRDYEVNACSCIIDIQRCFCRLEMTSSLKRRIYGYLCFTSDITAVETSLAKENLKSLSLVDRLCLHVFCDSSDLPRVLKLLIVDLYLHRIINCPSIFTDFQDRIQFTVTHQK